VSQNQHRWRLRRLAGDLRHLWDLIAALEHLSLPLGLLVFVTIVGTAGYTYLLELSLLDGFYQAVLTLSTIGFEEVKPFTPATKLFTAGLVIGGVGAVFYTLTLLMATVVEGELRRQFRRRLMKRMIAGMNGHSIVCGFGRVGHEIIRGFEERSSDFVVIERDEEAYQEAVELGYPALHGDATQDGVLREAGIARARTLLASADSDAVNVYIALTARELNHELFIIARSENTKNEEKLRLAGVDKIVSPHMLSGRRMMLAAIQPLITDFVDTLSTGRHGDLILAEILVDAETALSGIALKDAFAGAQDTTILGVRRATGKLIVGPRGDTVIQDGDTVIILSAEDQVSRLRSRRAADRP